MIDDDDERRVKDLIAPDDGEVDLATRAQLERWFGLPSFEQLAEEEARRPPSDPELAARREAQERAIAAVDPALNAALYARGTAAASIVAHRDVDLAVIDPSISALDPALIARAEAAEPRIVDLPMDLREAMAECSPQALLRDLHRPELEFALRLEVDPALAPEEPIDPTAVVRAAMAHRPGAELLVPATRAIAADLEPMRRARREPWSELRTPNRRVVE